MSIELAAAYQGNLVKSYRDLAIAAAHTSACLNTFANHMASMEPEEVMDYVVCEEVPLLETKESAFDKKTAKGAKPQRDPAAPRKPASAFLDWQNATRQKFRDDNPGIPYNQIQTIMSAAWANITDAEKKPFNDGIIAKGIAYEKAKAVYDASEKPALWKAKLMSGDIPVKATRTKKAVVTKKRAADGPAEGEEVKKVKKVTAKKGAAAPVVVATPQEESDEDSSNIDEVESEEDDESDEDGSPVTLVAPVAVAPKKKAVAAKKVEKVAEKTVEKKKTKSKKE